MPVEYAPTRMTALKKAAAHASRMIAMLAMLATLFNQGR